MAWSDIVRSQMHQLNLIASWASQVQMGRVRDLCRKASAELNHELERLEATSPTPPAAAPDAQ